MNRFSGIATGRAKYSVLSGVEENKLRTLIRGENQELDTHLGNEDAKRRAAKINADQAFRPRDEAAQEFCSKNLGKSQSTSHTTGNAYQSSPGEPEDRIPENRKDPTGMGFDSLLDSLWGIMSNRNEHYGM